MNTYFSKMFVGGFNDEHIGHEVINFYLPDGKDYSFLYVPPWGHIADKKIENLVLIGPPTIKNSYPIIAIALNIQKLNEKERLQEENTTTYGKVSVKKINYGDEVFAREKANKKGSSVEEELANIEYLTFKVPKNCLKQAPKGWYIIPDKPSLNEEKNKIIDKLNQVGANKIIKLIKCNPQHEGGWCEYDEGSEIGSMFEDAKEWKNYPLKEVDISKQHDYNEECYLGFIHKEYEEIIHSNMIYSVISSNKTLANDFSYWLINQVEKKEKNKKQEFTCIPEKHTLTEWQKALKTYKGKASDETKARAKKILDKYKINPKDFSEEDVAKIRKQNGRIDLFITSEEYILIIENKIKSALNGIHEQDGETHSQIEKYQNYAEAFKKENEKYKNAKVLTYIFTPKYNEHIELYKDESVDRVITYDEIKNYFKKKEHLINIKEEYKKEFFNALAKQGLDKEAEINRRFIKCLKHS